jgi:ribosomal protein S7
MHAWQKHKNMVVHQVTRYRLMNPGIVQGKTKMAFLKDACNTLKHRTQEKKISVFAAVQEILIVR